MSNTLLPTTYSDIFKLAQTDSDKLDLFLLNIIELLQKKAEENMYPYLYSSPNPSLENDLARGESHYNDLIYNVPQYYLYRDEVKILQNSVAQLATYVPTQATLIEFGVGTEIAFRNKTLPFLQAIDTLHCYVPIDLCVPYLTQAQAIMHETLPHVKFQGIETDFVKNVSIVQQFENPVVFFKGSTITNLRPDKCVEFFHNLANVLPQNGMLIVGEDSNNDETVLRQAYVNDALANTMLSIFYLLHRDYQVSGFDPSAFDYRFDWLAERYCVKHTAVATKPQNFTLSNAPIEIQANDEFHIVSSYKYPVDFFQNMANQGGLTPVALFSEPNNPMVIHVFQKQ